MRRWKQRCRPFLCKPVSCVRMTDGWRTIRRPSKRSWAPLNFQGNGGSTKGRAIAIRVATLNAARVPLHTVRNAVKVMELAGRCAKDGNLNAISDAMSGSALARASLTAAGYNVRINLNSLEDKSAGKQMLIELLDWRRRQTVWKRKYGGRWMSGEVWHPNASWFFMGTGAILMISCSFAQSLLARYSPFTSLTPTAYPSSHRSR